MAWDSLWDRQADHIGSKSPVTLGPPLSLHPMFIFQYILSDFCLNSKDSMGLTSKEQEEQGHQELHTLHLLLTQDTQGKGRQPPLAYLSTLVSSCFLLGPWPQMPPWSPYLSLSLHQLLSRQNWAYKSLTVTQTSKVMHSVKLRQAAVLRKEVGYPDLTSMRTS